MAKYVVGEKLRQQVAALERIQKGIRGSKNASEQLRLAAKLAETIGKGPDQSTSK